MHPHKKKKPGRGRRRKKKAMDISSDTFLNRFWKWPLTLLFSNRKSLPKIIKSKYLKQSPL